MAGLPDRVATLERQLRETTQERDELALDVERLCLSSGAAKFDATDHRVRRAEAEVRELRRKLTAVELERDTLRDELRGARNELGTLSSSVAERNQSLDELEQEVALLKQQSSSARHEAEETQAALERATAELERTSASLREAEVELSSSRKTCLELQQSVQDLQQLLGRERAALVKEQERAAEGEAAREGFKQVQEELGRLRAQLEEAQADAAHTHKLLKQAHKIEDQLNQQVLELQVRQRAPEVWARGTGAEVRVASGAWWQGSSRCVVAHVCSFAQVLGAVLFCNLFYCCCALFSHHSACPAAGLAHRSQDRSRTGERGGP